MKASTTTTAPAAASNAVPGASFPSQQRSSRVAPHSHIRGLGLDINGYASPNAGGFVGQDMAREVSFDLFYLSVTNNTSNSL